jgi:very-short-patch-repair endonuclease
MITHYTDKQLEVEMVVNNIGFMTELEKPFGQYCVDIWVPELDWAIEIDGPQHYSKKDAKRDEDLVAMGVKAITHLDSNIGRSEAKVKLKNAIECMR